MPNKLIHKLQAHSQGPKGVEENKLEELAKENECQLKYFAVKRSTLKGCRRSDKTVSDETRYKDRS